MPDLDLNLLTALRALLEEESVAGAARRTGLSPSAMSRALGRLRIATGDPLLVRAGRGLVPTPRAQALRGEIAAIVEAAERALTPTQPIDPATLRRTFTIRAGEGFVEHVAPALIRRIQSEAPHVRLRCVQKLDRDPAPLRSGAVDVEVGVLNEQTAPELRRAPLYVDRFVGVARAEHPIGEGPVTAAAYARARHVEVAQHAPGPMDRRLEALGLQREIWAVVSGFNTAISLASATDLIATVPATLTRPSRAGVLTFPLPFEGPEIRVSLLWHPRMEADPGHVWLRGCLQAICGALLSSEAG